MAGGVNSTKTMHCLTRSADTAWLLEKRHLHITPDTRGCAITLFTAAATRAFTYFCQLSTAPKQINSKYKCFGSKTKHAANPQFFLFCCCCPLASPRSDQWISRMAFKQVSMYNIWKLFLLCCIFVT